jgi:hypothetical protein
MSASPSPQPQKAWYRHPYLWLVIALPALAVCVSLWFVSMSFRHQDDMVRDDWYMDGKTLQQDLSRDTNAVKWGIHAQFDLQPDGTITAQLHSTTGRAFPALLWLNWYHPTHAEHDQQVTLQATNVAGQYRGSLAPLPHMTGRYHLELEDGDVWRLQDNVRLPATRLVLNPQAVVH